MRALASKAPPRNGLKEVAHSAQIGVHATAMAQSVSRAMIEFNGLRAEVGELEAWLSVTIAESSTSSQEGAIRAGAPRVERRVGDETEETDSRHDKTVVRARIACRAATEK